MIKLIPIALLAILAGCGGGSSGGSGSLAPATSALAQTTASSSDTSATPVATSQKLGSSWVNIAAEGQSFTVAAGTVVQYGAGSSWVQQTVSGAGTCSNDFFGTDPDYGVVKACYAQTGSTTTSSTTTATTATVAAAATTTGTSTTTTSWTSIAAEGQTFSVASNTLVRYGAGSAWVTKTVSGSGTCSNTFFGSDPAYGVVKGCYSQTTTTTSTATPTTTTTTTGSTGTTFLANENGTFTVAANTLVQYGANSSWIQKTISGTATCSNTYFGNDPDYGVAKACYSVGSSSASSGTTTSGSSSTGTTTGSSSTGSTTTTGSTATGGTAVAGDIVDNSLNVNASAYRAMAAQLSSAAGIAYRYGSASSTGGLPTQPAATSTAFPAGSPYGTSVTWQIGGPYSSNSGDYSSTVGQYAFVPDNTSLYQGVGSLEFLAQRNNTYSEIPQPSWTTSADVALAAAGSQSYYGAGTPTAMGRCYGRLTWCVESILAFPNGVIGSYGSNTAPDHTSTQLAAGKVPTAVAVTNGGEFALITVWDTVNLKGQVAVVALAGGCSSCAGGAYWGDWLSPYPGLPNLGNVIFMKVIGYVDLPGMTAPTEISVTNGLDNESMHRVYVPTGGGNCASDFTSQSSLPLNVAANRQTFTSGGCNYNSIAHGGVAVVVSKSEQKAAFINLKPLFDYYSSMYFSDSNFSQTTNLGQGASQWPYTFDTVPSQAPTVISTISLNKRPTAVKAALYGTQQAWIATQDGTLQIYTLGSNAYTGTVAASDIGLVGSVTVGANPTALAYSKQDPAEDDVTLNDNVIVVSRGTKAIQWVHFTGNTGAIRRTLQDSRLQDPIWAEDDDNHGTTSYVLTVADYGGKQISDYRYGPVTFMTNSGGACQPPGGCGMSGSFEYGGSYSLAGKGSPYQLSGANVP